MNVGDSRVGQVQTSDWRVPENVAVASAQIDELGSLREGDGGETLTVRERPETDALQRGGKADALDTRFTKRVVTDVGKLGPLGEGDVCETSTRLERRFTDALQRGGKADALDTRIIKRV